MCVTSSHRAGLQRPTAARSDGAPRAPGVAAAAERGARAERVVGPQHVVRVHAGRQPVPRHDEAVAAAERAAAQARAAHHGERDGLRNVRARRHSASSTSQSRGVNHRMPPLSSPSARPGRMLFGMHRSRFPPRHCPHACPQLPQWRARAAPITVALILTLR